MGDTKQVENSEMGMRLFYLLSAIVLGTLCGHAKLARAADESVQAALKSIGDMASAICPTVPFEQTSQGAKLTGQATLQLGKLLKFISDAGISGTVDVSSNHSIGVLQKDLASTIATTTNCKLSVFTMLVPRLISFSSGKSKSDDDHQPLDDVKSGFSGDAFWADNGDIFEHKGTEWIERTTNGQCCSYTFKEASRTADMVELYDGNRSMTLRLPIPSGISSWRQYNKGDWFPWLNVVHKG